jgi:hypothetical protein
MSANQPSQPTAATRFLIHTLLSFGVGLLFAVLTAIGNYIYTAGNAIDIKVVATVAGGAFLAYLLSHFNSDIKPNLPQIEQSINDLLPPLVHESVTNAVQDAHAPLYNAVGQLQQQVAQVAQTVQAAPQAKDWIAGASGQPAPLPPQPQNVTSYARATGVGELVPVSQLPTQDMPVIVSQPWQPPDPSIGFGDSAVMPSVTQ